VTGSIKIADSHDRQQWEVGNAGQVRSVSVVRQRWDSQK
jgi:hypothetical protein